MSALDGPRTVAVLDVGKTNVKVVLVDAASGHEVAARTLPNAVRHDGPYPHADTDRLAGFFIDSLADLAANEGFDAISVTAHGATAALLRQDGLALPVLDYEHDGPDETAADYDRVRPAFHETFSPRLPAGLNLGAQLFWQARRFPDAFAGATIVTYPQYWSWWLTGVAANEPTSLGSHTDLWDPSARRWSSLVAAAGWTPRMAPLRSAFDVLGPVRPDLARRIGLTRPAQVVCGIHDSNASLLPHIQGGITPLSVVSTGTWAIVFAVGAALDRLDPARDTLANVDAYGRPVPSARFMGGREFDILTGGAVADPDAATIGAVLERGLMALPTFVPGSGPFPRARGRWSHDPTGLNAAERTVVASLYVALMTATCLDLLGAGGPTVVEGPFARNRLYRDTVAALTDRPVMASTGRTGTSGGAARLVEGGPAPGAPTMDTIAPHPGLAAYAARWREEAGRLS